MRERLPRELLIRRWIVLRFAVRLSQAGQSNDRSKVHSLLDHRQQATRYGFARWLMMTHHLTDYPDTLPSQTTPLSYFLGSRP